MSEAALFTAQELDTLIENIDYYEPEDQAEILDLIEKHEQQVKMQAAQNDLLEFCKMMQPDYNVGAHHKILAKTLMQVEKGEKDRVTVSIGPRHGKSQLSSIYYSAWFLGRNPTKSVMLVSHTADLAVDFGRKVRNLISTDEYRQIFPDVQLSADSKSAGRWNTNKGGMFYATGVGSSLAGRGADMLIIDDPHSEQDMLAGNFDALDVAYKWYTIGARTRLMSGGRVAMIATRWHKADLIGRVIEQMAKNPLADQFEVIEFPCILNEHTPDEKALWPEFFDLDALRRTRETMPTYQWNAQYQQNPTGESASLVKREWFKIWPKDKPPPLEYIIQAIDAAAEMKNRSDYTSIATWGVFFDETDMRNKILLLNSIRERMEFHELKRRAMSEYKFWEPDSCLVEKKSSGTPLYQEMRRMGVPVRDYTPHRGTANSPNTKYVRLNSVSDMIREGLVYIPEKRWAHDLVEEIVDFPNAKHDDRVDTTIMALMRFRQGGFARLETDIPEETVYFGQRRQAYY